MGVRVLPRSQLYVADDDDDDVDDDDDPSRSRQTMAFDCKNSIYVAYVCPLLNPEKWGRAGMVYLQPPNGKSLSVVVSFEFTTLQYHTSKFKWKGMVRSRNLAGQITEESQLWRYWTKAVKWIAEGYCHLYGHGQNDHSLPPRQDVDS
jgi:hypothetical protein